MLSGRIKGEFDIDVISDPEMESFLQQCIDVYAGHPYWSNNSTGIRTINFAKSICSEIARLTVLGAKVTIDGSARADWLQERVDDLYFNMRAWVERAAACGTVILKPNGNGVDLVPVTLFKVTNTSDGRITGAVFYDSKYDSATKKWYTRLEWHRFDDEQYRITNRCFVSDSANGNGKYIPIESTPWSMLDEDTTISGVERMLFGVLRMPEENNLEPDSALGLPVFASAINELQDLDVAYCRNAKEILDSSRTVLIDSDRLFASGSPISATRCAAAVSSAGLPDYVRMVEGDGQNEIYHEINPSLNTETRLVGINALLSQIGYKCGFSNGYFVFNESTGLQTATQVEADQQRTIQLIKDVRDKLEDCLDGLLYALNVFADLYDLAPRGDYEVVYDFGDITYNREEDKQTWWKYRTIGDVPPWKYYVKFEGMSEEDAKRMIAEAKQVPTLFSEE